MAAELQISWKSPFMLFIGFLVLEENRKRKKYDDDDDDDVSLFQVHQLDNYKDRSPGLHMWTLPPLVPTSHPLVHHQNFRKEKEKKENRPHWPQLHPSPVAGLSMISNCTPTMRQSSHICLYIYIL